MSTLAGVDPGFLKVGQETLGCCGTATPEAIATYVGFIFLKHTYHNA